jgi:hypothetical protein
VVALPQTELVIVNVSGSSTVIVAVLVAVEFATAVAVSVTLRELDSPAGAVYVTGLAFKLERVPQVPVRPGLLLTQFDPVRAHVTPWLKRSFPSVAVKINCWP